MIFLYARNKTISMQDEMTDEPEKRENTWSSVNAKVKKRVLRIAYIKILRSCFNIWGMICVSFLLYVYGDLFCRKKPPFLLKYSNIKEKSK